MGIQPYNSFFHSDVLHVGKRSFGFPSLVSLGFYKFHQLHHQV